jgi:hypothetical protein
MVHHDIWDYDGATAPKLLTVRHEGKAVDIVALPTKQGWVWVFDRVTGKPLWPIEERPVPASDMPGEITSKTQPFPLKPPPFARQKFTADDLSPFLSPADRSRWQPSWRRRKMAGARTKPETTKPAEEYDESLKPYAAAAEEALNQFFTSGEREDAAHFFNLLDAMKESARLNMLTDELKGLTVAATLAKGGANA